MSAPINPPAPPEEPSVSEQVLEAAEHWLERWFAQQLPPGLRFVGGLRYRSLALVILLVQGLLCAAGVHPLAVPATKAATALEAVAGAALGSPASAKSRPTPTPDPWKVPGLH